MEKLHVGNFGGNCPFFLGSAFDVKNISMKLEIWDQLVRSEMVNSWKIIGERKQNIASDLYKVWYRKKHSITSTPTILLEPFPGNQQLFFISRQSVKLTFIGSNCKDYVIFSKIVN